MTKAKKKMKKQNPEEITGKKVTTVIALKKHNQVLDMLEETKKTLSFYADRNNYKEIRCYGTFTKVSRDKGAIARECILKIGAVS